MPLTETVVEAPKPHPERHRWVNDGPNYRRTTNVRVYVDRAKAEFGARTCAVKESNLVRASA
jgi:hypothetical protein